MAGWSIPTELVGDVRAQAMDELLDLGPELIAALLGADGGAPGDANLSPAQRIERFIDDAQSGALDFLRIQSPDVYEQYVREFNDDVANSPLMQHIAPSAGQAA